jgi:predicted nucleic acid-binding protein
MSAREFVDTNLLIYMHDQKAGGKQDEAFQLLNRVWESGTGCVSVQVLQEFYVASTGKLGMLVEEAEGQVARLTRWKVHAPTHADVLAAIRLQRGRMLSFWDAMIIHSASSLECSVLWTEDLNHGEVISGVEIRNPFA